MWINFYSPKESMYIYSLIFLVTAAVHAHNNNKVHIFKKRVADGSEHMANQHSQMQV